MTAIETAVWPVRVVTNPSESRDAVLRVIRGVRHRLTLSLFRCTDDAVISELARAAERGVQVDVLVTSRSKGKRKLRRLWRALDTTGAAVHAYVDPVVKYHAKYLVADEGPALVMSFNFTRKCFRSTIDAVAMTFDEAVVDALRRLHAADCAGRRLPEPWPEQLIIGPERGRRQLANLIENARSSIQLIDSKFSDPMMMKLLDRRHRDGVAVELHTGKRLNGIRSHGKLLLIDNQVAVIGSVALAALSLDFRREVALVVRHPGAVATVAQLFDSIGTREPTRRAEGSVQLHGKRVTVP